MYVYIYIYIHVSIIIIIYIVYIVYMLTILFIRRSVTVHILYNRQRIMEASRAAATNLSLEQGSELQRRSEYFFAKMKVKRAAFEEVKKTFG